MPSAAIHGSTIVYQDEGRGPPVVLVHAFPLSSAMWQGQIAALSGRYRVIAPDTRGLGASELGAAPMTIERYADDLAALLDQLGIAQAPVVGLSMGGYIAFALLRRHAGRVSALVLANTRAGADSDEGRRTREQSASTAEEQGSGVIADAMLPRLLSDGASHELRQRVRRMITDNTGAGIAAAQRAMAGRPDSTELLRSIAVPTLIVSAGRDVLILPEEGRAMHEAISDSRLLELPDSGHLSNLEAPEPFNEALAEHLGSLGPA